MAIKPVSLTYGGDASTALKWAGFAKKKARQLADWCMATGQSTGNENVWPIAGIKIRVWYNNGFLKAHIEAEGGLVGVAFWGVTSSFPHGWGEPYTELNSPLGTAAGDYAQSIVTPKERLVRAPGYKAKLGIPGGDFLVDTAGWVYDRLQYGSKVCQVRPGQLAYSIHRHELGTRYFGAEGSSDIDRLDFARGGVGESTSPYYCHGAFSYNGASYAVVHVGTFSTGGGFSRTFDSGSVLKVLRVATGNPSTWASVGEVAVNGLSVTDRFPGAFNTSRSGATSVAIFCGSSATRIRPMILKLSTDEDSVVTATFHVQAEEYGEYVSIAIDYTETPPLDTTSALVTCPAYDTEYVSEAVTYPDNSAAQNKRLIAWDIVDIAGVETVVFAWVYAMSTHRVVATTAVVANSAHTIRWYNYWATTGFGDLVASGCISGTPFVFPISETASRSMTATNGIDVVITGTSETNAGTGSEIARKSGLGLAADGLIYGAGMSGSSTTTYEISSGNVFTITSAPSGSAAFSSSLISAVDLSSGVFLLTTYSGVRPYGLASATPAYSASRSVLRYDFANGVWTTSSSVSGFTGTFTKPAQASTGTDTLPYEQHYVSPVHEAVPTDDMGGEVPVMTAYRDGVFVAYDTNPSPAAQPTTTTAEPVVYSYKSGTLALVGEVDNLLGTPAVTSEAVTLKAIGVI